MAADRDGNFVRVALVLPTEYSYARGVLRGVIEATRERNRYAAAGGGGVDKGPAGRPWLFHVFRGIYGHSSKYLGRWLRDFEPHGVICEIYGAPLARFYGRLKVPVVELFKSRERSQFVRILPDDQASGRMAAQHFLDRGFRHFAFYGSEGMLWSQEREAGFRGEIERVFAERGKAEGGGGSGFTYGRYSIETASEWRAPRRQSAKQRAKSMGAWLASFPKPLAVFGANDLWGSELVQAARETGLKVPDEVAILGVDDEELLCEIAHPPLSSVRLGSEQIGHAAVRTMERLLAGEKLKGDLPRVPPVEIVTRQSTDVIAVEDPEVAQAIRLIRSRGAAELSVKVLLEKIPINRRTLERRFVKVLGHTPLDEINRVRFERVKSLLRSDLPIYQVARESGFRTPEYLATAFLKETGMSPTAYRRPVGIQSRQQK